ncbi:MAG: TolC family protein [Planctomycetaceae bacterium]
MSDYQLQPARTVSPTGLLSLTALSLSLLTGCASTGQSQQVSASKQASQRQTSRVQESASPIRLVSAQEDAEPDLGKLDLPPLSSDEMPDTGAWERVEDDADSDESGEDEETSEARKNRSESRLDATPLMDGDKLQLGQVINSVHQTFPLVEAAYLENQLASGNAIAAEGEFDTKLKLSSENGPTGFYQTYRQKAGFTQPLFNGGEVFGGYRIGRGDFEPWYQERQTNDGGEFKVGASVPLIRNRNIDARRAALWRANYDVEIAQPAIRGQLIGFTLDASLAYWKWVAEGRKYFAEREWLRLAAERRRQIERRVELGDLGRPEEIDTNRAIAKRKSKVIDQLRKVQQAAIKVSLFLRTADGQPIVPTLDQLPSFPDPQQIDATQVESDIALALSQRPDLQILQLKQQQLQIDLEEACNMGLPQLDAFITAGQDVGLPTSSKRDKSEFELDAGFFFEMPVQRRKAIGKSQAIEAKIAQVSIKERFTTDKITAGIRAALAGMEQAYEQAIEAKLARELAEEMASIERRKFRAGASDLLKVALREQYALEAVEGEVLALLNFFGARSNYFAELAFDRPPTDAVSTSEVPPAPEDDAANADGDGNAAEVAPDPPEEVANDEQ